MPAGGEHSFSMEVTERRGGAYWPRAAVALLAGLVVFVLQLPSLIIDTGTPICYGMLGAWTVPCGGWPAVVQGALVAGGVWLLLWWERWGALLTGLFVFATLFPWGGGTSTYPPTCFGLFGPFWTVPCGGWPAVAAGALVAGVGWLALRAWHRRT
jgi:hypothetical protein